MTKIVNGAEYAAIHAAERALGELHAAAAWEASFQVAAQPFIQVPDATARALWASVPPRIAALVGLRALQEGP